ncbi:MAG: hypothetical protein HZA51_10710 [Planctomycetes bacterium]|nr:hypothetical protein [Planctomycetota bacterium]
MALPAPQADRPNSLLGTMTTEEWMLVRLRDQLYGGHWDEMRIDLEQRRRGEPYIFKLVHRIEEDLERIARLQELETRLGINLGTHLPK